ncbi:MAG: rhodanese-like domain-containing protein [Candidatus Scalindua sp.]
MRKKRLFILIVMFAVTGIVTMSGCSRNQETLTWTEVIRDIRNKYPDVRQLRTDELYSWLTGPESESVILIDSRAKEEFRVSHITGARNIPYDRDPLKHLTDIKPDSPIVVYCSVGYRSSILAKKLQDMCFTKVYNLEGSIFKWANEDKPLVQNQTTVYKVHPYNAHWGRLLERKYHVKTSNVE